MDIIEFAEKFMNVELLDWQKKHLMNLYELSRQTDIRVVMPKQAGKHQIYIYMNQTKELIQHG